MIFLGQSLRMHALLDRDLKRYDAALKMVDQAVSLHKDFPEQLRYSFLLKAELLNLKKENKAAQKVLVEFQNTFDLEDQPILVQMMWARTNSACHERKDETARDFLFSLLESTEDRGDMTERLLLMIEGLAYGPNPELTGRTKTLCKKLLGVIPKKYRAGFGKRFEMVQIQTM